MPWNNQQSTTNEYRVTLGEVITQDNIIPFAKAGNTTLATLEESSTMFESSPNGQVTNQFLIEMSSDYRVTNRSVYTLNDWINELGGFYVAVSGFFLLIAGLITESMDDYLVGNLFKLQESIPKSDKQDFRDRDDPDRLIHEANQAISLRKTLRLRTTCGNLPFMRKLKSLLANCFQRFRSTVEDKLREHA
jgi:hypothetical protein